MIFISIRNVRRLMTGLGIVSVTAFLLPALTAQAGKAFIVQTNSAGDSVTLIDPVTDRIAAEIPDAEVIHGAAWIAAAQDR